MMIRPAVDLISGVWKGHYEQVSKKFPQRMTLEFADGLVRGDAVDQKDRSGRCNPDASGRRPSTKDGPAPGAATTRGRSTRQQDGDEGERSKGVHGRDTSSNNTFPTTFRFERRGAVQGR